MLYSDSMAAPFPYLNTILDAARESGRSEREISRTATGQPAALSLIKTGRVPSVERVRLLCSALDLEFYIGPPRAAPSPTTPGQEALPPTGGPEPAADDAPPPWVETLRSGLREDMTKLLGDERRRRRDDGDYAGSLTRHVEIREIVAGADSDARLPDTHESSYVAFRREWLRWQGFDPARCAVLAVQGKSMEPTVPDGSLILIDCTRRSPRDGRILVVRNRDSLAVRRAGEDADGRWRLVCDHPGWPYEPWPDEAEVVGEVRWVGTQLS